MTPAIALQSASLMLLFCVSFMGCRLYRKGVGKGYLALAFIWVVNAILFLSVALARKTIDGFPNVDPSFLNLWSNTIYFHASLTLFFYMAVVWLEGIPGKTNG